MLLQFPLDSLLLGCRLFVLVQFDCLLVSLHLQEESIVVSFTVLDEGLVRMKFAVGVEWIGLVHFLVVGFREKSSSLCATM